MITNKTDKTRIVHVITALPVGGSQTMLYKLLKEMLPHPYINEVVNLANDDIMSERIRALGIKVHSLEMKPSRPNIIKIFKRNASSSIH